MDYLILDKVLFNYRDCEAASGF